MIDAYATMEPSDVVQELLRGGDQIANRRSRAVSAGANRHLRSRDDTALGHACRKTAEVASDEV
jgi:hypothetical protein